MHNAQCTMLNLENLESLESLESLVLVDGDLGGSEAVFLEAGVLH